jgi:hypothetical protein
VERHGDDRRRRTWSILRGIYVPRHLNNLRDSPKSALGQKSRVTIAWLEQYLDQPSPAACKRADCGVNQERCDRLSLRFAFRQCRKPYPPYTAAAKLV